MFWASHSLFWQLSQMKRQISLVTSLTHDNTAASGKEIPGRNRYSAIKPCQFCYCSTEGLHQQDKGDRKCSPRIGGRMEKAGLLWLHEQWWLHEYNPSGTGRECMARGDCKASSAPGSPEFLLLGNWKCLPSEKKHHAVIYKQINMSRATFLSNFSCSLPSSHTSCHCWWIIPF